MREHNIDVDELLTSKDFAKAAYDIAYADGIRWERDLKAKIEYLFTMYKGV